MLAGIAVAASVVGYWAHETLLDTDKFMAAVTPAVESDAVKQVVADRLSDQVLEALDLDTRVAEALDRAGDRMTEAIARRARPFGRPGRPAAAAQRRVTATGRIDRGRP